MNIETLSWDPTLCRYFDIPMQILPEIRSSSEIYGHIKIGPLTGIPISGVSCTPEISEKLVLFTFRSL